MDDAQSISSQAHCLVAQIASKCSSHTGGGHPLGSMSSSIYDTAWLSMVEKPVHSGDWLFPQCFEFILRHQLENGAWESYATTVDGILNTAASLLALKRHHKFCPDTNDLEMRASKATAALDGMLQTWDVSSSDQVGFEILVVKHLELLELEGVHFEFPGSKELKQVKEAKMAKLPASIIESAPSTIYHSLEAMIGHVNFDRIKIWQEANGSMLGSPSSTAAYLMNSSIWDQDSEQYLKDVVQFGTGENDGGVPCAWPTTIFDATWVTSALRDAGHKLETGAQSTISSFLEQCLEAQNGILGFSPTSIPDADDTAKAIIALRNLGRNASVEPLIATFEGHDHFKTYHHERNPSFTTNCNVLASLLMQENLLPYIPQIVKVAKYLCHEVYSCNVVDKWHLNKLYWIMLFSQTMRLLHEKTENEKKLREELSLDKCRILETIPMVSLQLTLGILQTQKLDGSWEGTCELTAYAILALSSLRRLPWTRKPYDCGLTRSIERGKVYLESNRSEWAKARPLWIEKVTYSSNLLSEVYCVSAQLADLEKAKPECGSTEQGLKPFTNGRPFSTMREMTKAANLLMRTPLFTEMNPSIMEMAAIQASYGLCSLQRQSLDVFPRASMSDDNYLTFIPLTWTSCSARRGASVSMSVLREMMVLSMLNYQVDEFLEVTLGENCIEQLPDIRVLIHELCHEVRPSANGSNGRTNGHVGSELKHSTMEDRILADIEVPLRRYIRHILDHASVVKAPTALQNRLRMELETFLQAHVTQAEDNHRLSLEKASPQRSFYNWVRTTSADHTSCPFSFVFYFCLLECTLFEDSKTAYLAEDLCRHLATLCRIYNDCGSLARDEAENNLNSADFLRFKEKGTRRIKEELMWIADFERRGMNMALQSLSELPGTPGDILEELGLFMDVTDLYGQIYVLRDIGISLK